MGKIEKGKKEEIKRLPVNLPLILSKQIHELVENEDLFYRNGSDFVTKAVEKEIHLSYLKLGLSKIGKFYFDGVYQQAIIEAYDKAINFDRNIPPNHPQYQQVFDLQKIKEKEQSYKI